MSTIRLVGGTVVNSTGMHQTDVVVEDGIVQLGVGSGASGVEEINCEGKLLFPGFIDPHVHFREPGLEHKGTMQSEGTAAAAAGVTTVIDMPNTVPTPCTVETFSDKVERSKKVKDCDIRFFFGVTKKEHLENFRAVWTGDLRSHCTGIKLFLENSTGDLKVEPDAIEEAFKVCAELGAPIIAHCEDAAMNAEASGELGSSGGRVELHSQMRPPESEAKSIHDTLELVRQYGTKFHIAHLSTALGLAEVKAAKRERLPVTCEVAPHHLWLNVGDYEKLGTLGKMNPPLRNLSDNQALWAAVKTGEIDWIATDHAPHLLEEKNCDNPLEAPSGVPGVETLIALMLTQAAFDEINYIDIHQLCFKNANKYYGLGKDDLVEGASPDIVIIDPKLGWEIKADELKSKCDWTPFEGISMTGRVERVINSN